MHHQVACSNLMQKRFSNLFTSAHPKTAALATTDPTFAQVRDLQPHLHFSLRSVSLEVLPAR